MRHIVAALWAAVLLVAGGCGLPSFLITPVTDRNELEERRVLDGDGMFAKKVLILPIDGFLMNARSPGFMEPGENSVSIISQQLRRAEQDKSIAAVVLRINSPGGDGYRVGRGLPADSRLQGADRQADHRFGAGGVCVGGVPGVHVGG